MSDDLHVVLSERPNGGVIVKLDREIPPIGNSGARAALISAVQHVVRHFVVPRNEP
jgi:hypothetical protein